MALAIASAAGSVGQILGPPLAQALLAFVAWQTIFLIFAASILAMLVMLPLLKSPEGPARAEPEETLRAVLTRAFRDPSFTLIFIGFFSCGYQLGFITAHFPAFVTEMCGPIAPGGLLDNMGVSTTSALGAVAISVIGLANIGGTLLAGWAGNHFPKKYLLATIYIGRTLVSAAFILLPITPLTVIAFSVAMGALWLATVPLTSGLVGYIYGLRYMGTLYGIVFFSHQLGSFMGIWLGGRLYDSTGDYTAVWWVGIAVGAFSALVHLPIRERKMPVAVAA
jgi:predicted MFS family arabinose efflux permease